MTTNERSSDVAVNEDILQALRSQLYKQLHLVGTSSTCTGTGSRGDTKNTGGISRGIDPALHRIKECVDKALDYRSSSSLVSVASRESVGAHYSAACALVNTYGPRVRVAHLRGSVYAEDSRALEALGRQLLGEAATAKGANSFVLTISVLETELALSCQSGVPVVILIEDVQVFCRGRQMLLYSLLDLLHRPNMLFVVMHYLFVVHTI